ncbi:sperm associated antigen 17 [Perkinsus chesapeaki]|uniref:Sperm associated antigen 17 n=1 Tax=Perkinsus chesapeaki TaxID=330153 RepID=A0A7J6N1H0_PERCH|nr:sperm associated antigen 17 [Perkinsus chesapeaki]
MTESLQTAVSDGAMSGPQWSKKEVESRSIALAAGWKDGPNAEDLLSEALKRAGRMAEKVAEERRRKSAEKQLEEVAKSKGGADAKSEKAPLNKGRRNVRKAQEEVATNEDDEPPTVVDPYNYFQSEHGLNFLVENRMLGQKVDPDQLPPKPLPKLEVVGSREERAAFARRSPWDPLLPDEWDKMEKLIQEKELAYKDTSDELPEDSISDGVNKVLASITPDGPHPDKRGAQWDVYGEPRETRRHEEEPFILRNEEFVLTEAPVDRRIRTSSLARKLEAVEAPGAMEVRGSVVTVLQVRRAGGHRGPMDPYVHALAFSGNVEGDEVPPVEYLTGSLLGLGDPNKLIEVSPVRLAFGSVRQHGIYRMVVKVRNLDADVTRLKLRVIGNVPTKEAVVLPIYRPGPLPPGLAMYVGVEIIAREPCTVEVVLQIAAKGQLAQLPVVADVVSQRDYDCLPTGKSKVSMYRSVKDAYGPIEPWGDMVLSLTDEKYCRRFFRSSWRPMQVFDDRLPSEVMNSSVNIDNTSLQLSSSVEDPAVKLLADEEAKSSLTIEASGATSGTTSSVIASTSPSETTSISLAELEARRVNEIIKTENAGEPFAGDSTESVSIDAKHDIDARERKMVESFRRFEKDAENTIEAILSLDPSSSSVSDVESTNSESPTVAPPKEKSREDTSKKRPPRRYITFLRTLNDRDDEIEERNEKDSLVTRQELYTVALSSLVVMFLMAIGVVYYVQSESEILNTHLYDLFAHHNASLERACDYSGALMPTGGYHPVYATTGGGGATTAHQQGAPSTGWDARKSYIRVDEFVEHCLRMQAVVHASTEDLRAFYTAAFNSFLLDYPGQDGADPEVFRAVLPAFLKDIKELWLEYAPEHKSDRVPMDSHEISPARKSNKSYASSLSGYSVHRTCKEDPTNPVEDITAFKQVPDRRRMLTAARETRQRLRRFDRAKKGLEESGNSIQASAALGILRRQPEDRLDNSGDSVMIKSLRNQLARANAKLYRKEKEKSELLERYSHQMAVQSKELDAALAVAQERILSANNQQAAPKIPDGQLTLKFDKCVETTPSEESVCEQAKPAESRLDDKTASYSRNPVDLWELYVRPKVIDTLGEGQPARAFRAMDITNSGMVTKYEFARGLARIPEFQLSDDVIDTIFSRLDAESKGEPKHLIYRLN